MTTRFSQMIEQIAHICATNASVAKSFTAIFQTASMLPLPTERRDLWFLLNLLGQWAPGMALMSSGQAQTTDIPAGFQNLSAQEIEELHLVTQTIGSKGYHLLINALLAWLESTLPARRLKNHRIDWTGDGLLMLIKDLDRTSMLPPALLEWAKLDLRRELHCFKAHIEEVA